MKNTNLHRGSIIFLFLLTVVLLFSSVGSFYQEVKQEANAIESKSKKEGKEDEEKVSSNQNFVAVVVSAVHLDFSKEVVFEPTFTFSFTEKLFLIPKRFLVSEKYFSTLFTHIISPNAP